MGIRYQYWCDWCSRLAEREEDWDGADPSYLIPEGWVWARNGTLQCPGCSGKEEENDGSEGISQG